MRRDASDAIAIRNAQATIYFLLLIDIPLIISCFQVPSFRPWQAACGAPNVEKLGDRPWLVGKGFYTPSLVLLFPSLGKCQSPCSIFSDECHVIQPLS